MITNFTAVEPEIIKNFEAGILNKESFLSELKTYDILSFNTFEIIDYVLTSGSAQSALTVFTGEGEILADSGGEEFMFEWIDYSIKEGTKYSMSSPAIYKNKEDLEKAVKLSLSVDRELFKKKFNTNKMIDAGIFIPEDEEYVKSNKDEIILSAYEDFTKIRKFYLDALNAGKYVILFYLDN
ncbi:MAG: YfbM family protein [Endomicrobium sp.]|jgi:hypothetical protein|nr:YfbM family protein [Endomicrobium sp.]